MYSANAVSSRCSADANPVQRDTPAKNAFDRFHTTRNRNRAVSQGRFVLKDIDRGNVVLSPCTGSPHEAADDGPRSLTDSFDGQFDFFVVQKDPIVLFEPQHAIGVHVNAVFRTFVFVLRVVGHVNVCVRRQFDRILTGLSVGKRFENLARNATAGIDRVL